MRMSADRDLERERYARLRSNEFAQGQDALAWQQSPVPRLVDQACERRRNRFGVAQLTVRDEVGRDGRDLNRRAAGASEMESVDDHADVDRARVRRDPDSIAQGADRAEHHEFEADPEAILGRDGANASQALGMVDWRGRVRTELRPEAGHPRGAKLRCGLERSAYIILGRLVPEHQRLNIELRSRPPRRPP